MRIEGSPPLPEKPTDRLRGVEKFNKPKTPEEFTEVAEDVGEVALESEVMTGDAEPVLRGLEKFKKRELDSSIQHAPTWELELGKHGTGYGDLSSDGFEARNSNHSSGQDAFAISADGRRFAVADGLGGSGSDAEATSFLAKFMSDQVVARGVDTLFDSEAVSDIYKQAQELFESRTGRKFEAPSSILRSELISTAATTLTYAEIVGQRDDRTLVRIVTIGDSPVFVTDGELTPTTQLGEDAQSGQTDAPLAFKLGIDRSGAPIVPEKDVNEDGRYVVDEIIEVPAGNLVVLGSDYFSDTVHYKGRFGNLRDFAGLTPESYHEKVKSIGKPDDATLIVIDPSRV